VVVAHKDPEKAKEYYREYGKKHRQKNKRYHWLRQVAGRTKNPITVVIAFVDSHSGVCDICGELATVVDHDHTTLALRGMLCHNCNVGLGHFRDDKNRMLAAIEYLARAAREEN
jgi:16S rRNA G1207 methylase RsmC